MNYINYIAFTITQELKGNYNKFEANIYKYTKVCNDVKKSDEDDGVDTKSAIMNYINSGDFAKYTALSNDKRLDYIASLQQKIKDDEFINALKYEAIKGINTESSDYIDGLDIIAGKIEKYKGEIKDTDHVYPEKLFSKPDSNMRNIASFFNTGMGAVTLNRAYILEFLCNLDKDFRNNLGYLEHLSSDMLHDYYLEVFKFPIIAYF